MTLVKFNPVRDLIDFEREFNKMFNRNRIFMDRTIDLPGIKKEDVKISFTNGKLNISGERIQEAETKDAKCHRIEKSYGKYFRSFNLPELIQAEKINAEFANGQLTITIPKAEEAKPKEIEIKVK